MSILQTEGLKKYYGAGNTLVKSWLIHAHAVTCGAVVGAKVPIALTSRSANEEETYLSLVFCAVLDAWRKKNREAAEGK